MRGRMYNRKLGYDMETLYSEDELYQMYINEGKLPEEAKRLASTFYNAQKDMFWRLKYSWERVREHEYPGRFAQEENSNDG